jgi:hypothetical protein
MLICLLFWILLFTSLFCFAWDGFFGQRSQWKQKSRVTGIVCASVDDFLPHCHVLGINGGWKVQNLEDIKIVQLGELFAISYVEYLM